MRIKLGFAIAILISAAILIALQLRTAPLQKSAAELKAPESVAVLGAAPEPQALAHATAAAEDMRDVKPPTDAGLKTWLKSEAQQMDMPRVDSERKEREMNLIATRLSAPQRRELLRVARHPKSPAGEKVLAAYLLVQAGAQGMQELKELIVSPVSEAGETHSVAEMNSMRDKTLRIMALDGLSSRAQNDAQARATLAKTIEEIQDPYVKSYAEKQLTEILRK